jgi:hypothetical protein
MAISMTNDEDRMNKRKWWSCIQTPNEPFAADCRLPAQARR